MVSKEKVSLLRETSKILTNYKTILLFDLQSLPSRQLHEIRNKLKKEEIYTTIVKKKVLELCFKNTGLPLNLEEINQPALIYSNKDIFYITEKLKKLKVGRKAKVAEISTSNIEIPAGNTNIQAGPAISTFKQFKIQTTMKDGKIWIKEPTIICKKGDIISTGILSLLNMLNIEPIEMSIQPKLGYNENIVYDKNTLGLDEEYFKEQISLSGNNVFKLTVSMNYPTKQNISFLVQKSFQRGKTLSIKLGLPAKEIMPELIKLAGQRAEKLNSSF